MTRLMLLRSWCILMLSRNWCKAVICFSNELRIFFFFQATRIGRETTLRQIVRLVEGAQLSKPLFQAFADRMSAYFVPFVVVGALVTWASWFAAGKRGAVITISVMISNQCKIQIVSHVM